MAEQKNFFFVASGLHEECGESKKVKGEDEGKEVPPLL